MLLRSCGTRVLSQGSSKLPPIQTALRRRAFADAAARSAVANSAQLGRQMDPVLADQITTLSNGVRVATESLPGPFSAVGVYVEAGSRFESEHLRGVSQIIDRLAFKSTKSRTSDQMLETVESLGGNVQCASARESLMYQCASFNSEVSAALGVLAETIRDPLVTDEEVSLQLATASYEIGEIEEKPELILPELVHVAAYKDNTLGNPLLCPRDRLQQIDSNTIHDYRDTFYKPERMVIAFAGVDHGVAVNLSERLFGDMQSQDPKFFNATLPRTNSSSGASQTLQLDPSRHLTRHLSAQNFSTSTSNFASLSSLPLESASSLHLPLLSAADPSKYTGGFMTLPQLPPLTNPALPDLSYVHLAMEALPISSPDMYALATLQMLLGGGGAFSAGGPGKGMYSRLYTNVLNQCAYVESCVAFNHSYTDSGLFGISASCRPDRLRTVFERICRELEALTLEHGRSALQEGEVRRAKNQLRSALLMNLESRMIVLEDLGRQVQVHGRKIGVLEMCDNIERLTVYDLRRVAKQVVGGLIDNVGHGTGAATVVVQEGTDRGLSHNYPFSFENAQEVLAKHHIGRM